MAHVGDANEYRTVNMKRAYAELLDLYVKSQNRVVTLEQAIDDALDEGMSTDFNEQPESAVACAHLLAARYPELYGNDYKNVLEQWAKDAS